MKIINPETNHIPQLRSLWKEAFGDDDGFLDSFFSTAFSTQRSRCVTENGRVVAMLYWFDCEYEGKKIAYIYAVATAVSHRGRGICKTLMDDTHNHLRSLGYAGALLVPGSESLFTFYGKMNYKTCCYGRRFSRQGREKAVVLTKIGREEYAILRRSYLPENSVIQEKENLSFLETQAEFYKGDDFVMSAYAENGHLTCIELLGNTEAASGIVYALDCTEGDFFTPGNELPLGMYLPFDNSVSYPSYFGLAFN